MTKNSDSKKNKKKKSEINTNETENDENFQNSDDNKDYQEKIIKLQEDLSIAKEGKLRLLAEMENLRKRVEKEKIESIKFGSINLSRDILSPCDNLVRALDSLSNGEKNDKDNKSLLNGLRMVHQELIAILEKHGVKKINALNEKFDHNFHQAMMEIESDDAESGTVVQELQAGYTMHDRLLRPSMVGVSKKKEEENQENNENIKENEEKN